MRMYIEISTFLLGIKIVFSQDDFGNQNVEVEYSSVFKNIPTLFEYLLDTLEEKPEVLEKNDLDLVKTVEDEDLATDDVTRFHRSVEDKKGEERSITEESMLYEGTHSCEGKDNDGYTDEAMKDKSIYISNTEMNRNMNKVQKRKADEHEDEIEDTEDVFWPLDENIEKMFRLTSEEIAQQALKVEEMLEQHNNSK